MTQTSGERRRAATAVAAALLAVALPVGLALLIHGQRHHIRVQFQSGLLIWLAVPLVLPALLRRLTTDRVAAVLLGMGLLGTLGSVAELVMSGRSIVTEATLGLSLLMVVAGAVAVVRRVHGSSAAH